MDQLPAADPHESQPAQDARASAAPALDPAIFQFLLSRIEYLSRELGRAEGKQSAFERQVARLEQQLSRLEHDRGEG
jgi:hypothetical protein